MEDGSHGKALIIKTYFKSAVDFPAVLSWGLSSALLQRHTLQLLLYSSFLFTLQTKLPLRVYSWLSTAWHAEQFCTVVSQNCIYSQWVAKESCPIWHYCSATVLATSDHHIAKAIQRSHMIFLCKYHHHQLHRHIAHQLEVLNALYRLMMQKAYIRSTKDSNKF